MEIKNIKREDGKVSFQVTVDAESFEAAINKAYLKAKKNIFVPGFRKGKAPRMVVEGMYGAGVFYEDAVESMALDCFKAGMEEAKDRTVGDPAITKYDVAEDKTLTIDFEAALYPEVTLGEYKGVSAYKAPVKVSADDVKQELEKVRDRNARIVTVDRPAKMGDTVNLDYDGYKDGVRFDGGKAEGHDLVLGSHQFVPGFEEQMVGMAAGEEKDIDITFPENYHEGLAGAAVVFKIKVNEVKERQKPELDDEFAKDVSEFDTLKEYKADIKKNIEDSRKETSDNDFRNAVLEKAAANMTVTIPDAMVTERVNSVIQDYARNCAMQGITLEQYFGYMGINEETFRHYLRPNCEKDVRTTLLLEKVAEVVGFPISPEEIEEEYQRQAENYGLELDRVKSTVPEDIVASDLKLRKAADFLVENAVALDKPEEEPAAEEAAAEEKKPAKKSTRKSSAKKAEAPAEEAPAEAAPAEEKKPAAKRTSKKAAPKAEPEKTEE